MTAPSTPPNPPTAIKVTLPTPKSFGAHRRSQSINSPASVTGSPQRQSRDTPKRGHNRTVSFSQDVEVKTMTPESKQSLGGSLYRIPQRQEQDSIASPTDDLSPRVRKGPPSALSFGPRTSFGPTLLSPFTGPKTAPANSRFASTAAARGLSIAPALAKLKEKRSSNTGQKGHDSIWSAGLTSTGGWITPGLASARSTTSVTTGTARQRGLSVAVIKDGKEMLVDSGPITPGLPSARRKSIETAKSEAEPVQEIRSPRPLSATRPKEGTFWFAFRFFRLSGRLIHFSDSVSVLPHSRLNVHFATVPLRSRPLRSSTFPFRRPSTATYALAEQIT